MKSIYLMAFILLLSVLLLLLESSVFAQPPQAFKYQAVVRDNAGEIIANQTVSFRISIRTGSAGGTIVYQEIHSVTTNEFGLANLNIGNGTPVSGNFISIDWGTSTEFLEVELDIWEGYFSMGTTQLISVPYALYSENTANTDDADADPDNELITSINLNGTNLEVTDAGGTIITDLTNLQEDADADPSNELQNLTLNENDLSISDGNTVALPTGVPSGTTGQTLRHNGTIWEANDNLFHDGINVGIGTSNPESKVDITGDVNVSGSYRIGSQIMLAPGTNNNTFVGNQYGPSSTGSDNTFVGYNAGLNNTEGSSNTFLGYAAGINCEGTGNVFVGWEVGRDNFSGWNQLYIANSSTNNPLIYGEFDNSLLRINGTLDINDAYTLPNIDGLYGQILVTNGAGLVSWENESGIDDDWTIAGDNMYSTVTGNVGIGTSTPSEKLHITDGDLKLDVSNFYKSGTFRMGSWEDSVGGYFNNMEYENGSFSVINPGESTGNVLLGTASYGIYLDPDGNIPNSEEGGNNLVRFTPTQIKLKTEGYTRMTIDSIGSVGIGTTSPSEKLHIEGNLRMVDGNQQDGRVMVSDAQGTGSWVDASFVSDSTWTISGNTLYSSIDSTLIIDNGKAVIGIPDLSGKSNTLFKSKDGLKSKTLFHKLTVGNASTINVLRLIGPYLFGHGARLNFGDGNFAYIDEDQDDKLTIHANRVAFTGGLAGRTKLDVAGHIWQTNTGHSVFVGEGAGQNDDFSDNYNVAIGDEALYTNTSGWSNTAVGAQVLYSNTTGYNNTAIGTLALIDLTTGNNNTAIGELALSHLQTGNNNTALGTEAGGVNNWTGSGNVFIGYQAGYYELGSDKLYIANSSTDPPLIYGDFLEGKIGFGTTSPYLHKVTIQSSTEYNLRLIGPEEGLVGYGARLNFGNGDYVYLEEDQDDKLWIEASRISIMGGDVGIGTIYPNEMLTVDNSTTIGTYTTSGWQHTSDKRLKTNISKIENAMDKIEELEGVYFDWKNTNDDRQVGLIAQDVEKVLPEVVNHDDKGYFSISYGAVVPVLIEAIKEQQKEIEILKEMVEKLEAD